jgi:hypothetical protein
MCFTPGHHSNLKMVPSLNGDLGRITSILLYFIPQLHNGAPQHNSVLFGNHYLEALQLPA